MVDVAKARDWLAKRGVRVDLPTRLLALRIGARHNAVTRAGFGLRAIFGFVGVVGAIGYQCLQYLPDVRGVEMTESKIPYFLIGSAQLATWFAVRRRDRLTDWARRPAGSARWKLLGGWYLMSVVITFAGGAALGVAMYVTTSARTYAWSWLGALGVGAVCFAVILTDIVRRPALAEDTASLAVDDILRVEDAHVAMPALFAVPVLLDLLTTHRQPHEFTLWLAVYAALAAGTQLAGRLAHRRRHRTLPLGYYGSPAMPVVLSPPFDWSPGNGGPARWDKGA
jgi:hypothetical protein